MSFFGTIGRVIVAGAGLVAAYQLVQGARQQQIQNEPEAENEPERQNRNESERQNRNEPERQNRNESESESETESESEPEDRKYWGNRANHFREDAKNYAAQIEALKRNLIEIPSSRGLIQQQIYELKKKQNEANLNARQCFMKRNQLKMPNALDLHGLYVEEAKDEVLGAIAKLPRNGRSTLYIITGVGNHSVDGQPKLQPAIRQLLESKRLKFQEKKPGHFYVTI